MKTHFKVNDVVKIKIIDGVLRPCTGSKYKYKITKVRRFLWSYTYDLECIECGIKQKKVPERELVSSYLVL